MNPSPMVEQYHQQGYLVQESLFSAAECAALKAEAQRLLNQVAPPGRTVVVGAAAHSPLFYQLASDQRLVKVLRELLQPGVMFLSDKIVFKSREHSFATPWHQDVAYWPGTRPKISTWLALDDVNATNGALRILPGSHHQHREHQATSGSATNGEFGQVLAALQNERTGSVDGEMICALSAGSVLFFSDRLAHASCPNQSGEERYALIGTYQSVAPDEPFDLQFPARHVVA